MDERPPAPENDDTETVTETKFKTSILKPPKARIPLHEVDLGGGRSPEYSETTRNRRVSFRGVNTVKEFCSKTESQKICHIDPYEESFTLSDSSVSHSGLKFDHDTDASENVCPTPKPLVRIEETVKTPITRFSQGDSLKQSVSNKRPILCLNNSFNDSESEMDSTLDLCSSKFVRASRMNEPSAKRAKGPLSLRNRGSSQPASPLVFDKSNRNQRNPSTGPSAFLDDSCSSEMSFTKPIVKVQPNLPLTTGKPSMIDLSCDMGSPQMSESIAEMELTFGKASKSTGEISLAAQTAEEPKGRIPCHEMSIFNSPEMDLTFDFGKKSDAVTPTHQEAEPKGHIPCDEISISNSPEMDLTFAVAKKSNSHTPAEPEPAVDPEVPIPCDDMSSLSSPEMELTFAVTKKSDAVTSTQPISCDGMSNLIRPEMELTFAVAKKSDAVTSTQPKVEEPEDPIPCDGMSSLSSPEMELTFAVAKKSDAVTSTQPKVKEPEDPISCDGISNLIRPEMELTNVVAKMSLSETPLVSEPLKKPEDFVPYREMSTFNFFGATMVEGKTGDGDSLKHYEKTEPFHIQTDSFGPKNVLIDRKDEESLGLKKPFETGSISVNFFGATIDDGKSVDVADDDLKVDIPQNSVAQVPVICGWAIRNDSVDAAITETQSPRNSIPCHESLLENVQPNFIASIESHEKPENDSVANFTRCLSMGVEKSSDVTEITDRIRFQQDISMPHFIEGGVSIQNIRDISLPDLNVDDENLTVPMKELSLENPAADKSMAGYSFIAKERKNPICEYEEHNFTIPVIQTGDQTVMDISVQDTGSRNCSEQRKYADSIIIYNRDLMKVHGCTRVSSTSWGFPILTKRVMLVFKFLLVRLSEFSAPVSVTYHVIPESKFDLATRYVGEYVQKEFPIEELKKNCTSLSKSLEVAQSLPDKLKGKGVDVVFSAVRHIQMRDYVLLEGLRLKIPFSCVKLNFCFTIVIDLSYPHELSGSHLSLCDVHGSVRESLVRHIFNTLKPEKDIFCRFTKLLREMADQITF